MNEPREDEAVRVLDERECVVLRHPNVLRHGRHRPGRHREHREVVAQGAVEARHRRRLPARIEAEVLRRELRIPTVASYLEVAAY